jgi:hypothetical protein
MARSLVRRLLLVGTVLLALPAAASAGSLVLHPNGFGDHSYSSWKADEGLPDSTGAKDQALYLQKNTATATPAAGVAVIKGVEGLPTTALGDLQFWWRTDTHCGAGAPRFNVRVQPALGPAQTIFIGCQGMVPGAVQMHEGTTFQQRTAPPGAVPPGQVVSLAIVFDEGNDVGRCADGAGVLTGESCVFLDDIRAAGHTWTSPSDNGNGQEITQSFDALDLLLGEPVELALAR